MSISQMLDTFRITTSSPPLSPSTKSPIRLPTPSKGPAGSIISRSSTLQSDIYPLDTSTNSHSSTGSLILPPFDFNPSLTLETPQQLIHRASVSSTESSVTFTEPEARRGSTDWRKEGRLRPATPSPILGSDGFQESASSMGTLCSANPVGGLSEMEKPRIIIGFYDEPGEGPKPILENGLGGQDGAEQVHDVVLPRQSGEFQGDRRDSRASSADRSTLVIPNLEDDGLGDVGSPRTGLKEFGSERKTSDARTSSGLQDVAKRTESRLEVRPPVALSESREKPVPIRTRAFLGLVYLVAGLSVFTQGYDQGVMTSIPRNMDFRTLMLICSVPITPRDMAAIAGLVAVYFAGSLVGGMAGGILGDRYGRVRVVWIGCLLGLLGGALQTSAGGFAWMCGARVVSGLGTGGIAAVIPSWAVEVAPSCKRGRSVATTFFFNVLGIAVGYWTYFVLSFKSTASQRHQWRFAIGGQLVFLLLLLALVQFMPESPRWIISQGKEEEARQVLASLGQDDQEETDKLIRDIRSSLKGKKRSSASSAKPSNVRRISLIIGLQIMQRLTGFTFVTYFGLQMYQSAGISAFKAGWMQGLNWIFYALVSLIPIWTLDTFGRRRSLILGSGIMAAAIGVCAAGSHFIFNAQDLDSPRDRVMIQWAALFCAGSFLFCVGHAISWMNIPWLYAAEAFPLESRGKGGMINVAAWSISKGAITLITPFLFRKLDSWSFLIFIGTNILAIPFTFLLLPETKRRGLETVHEVFEYGGHVVHRHAHHKHPQTHDAEDQVKTIEASLPSENIQSINLTDLTSRVANESHATDFSIAMHPRTMEPYAEHKKSQLPKHD